MIIAPQKFNFHSFHKQRFIKLILQLFLRIYIIIDVIHVPDRACLKQYSIIRNMKIIIITVLLVADLPE